MIYVDDAHFHPAHGLPKSIGRPCLVVCDSREELEAFLKVNRISPLRVREWPHPGFYATITFRERAKLINHRVTKITGNQLNKYLLTKLFKGAWQTIKEDK